MKEEYWTRARITASSGKIIGERLELALYGVEDLDENFEKEYSIPVFQGKGITTYADVIVEKRLIKKLMWEFARMPVWIFH